LSSKQPERLVFFLDRSLGKKIVADALRQAGALIEIHDDHFAPDAKDEHWLKEVGKRNWVVFTKDQRIRYRTTECSVLLENGVRAFVLTGKDLTGSEMGAIFLSALSRIHKLTSRTKGGFIARITRSGHVDLLLSGKRKI
jgi:predicted nuclease of predicted toxin-antitoxin system